MIDHDTFQNSYLAISSTLLLGVMFLILGLVLAIPLLHLKTMGGTDPLRITHVLTVVLAAFLGTGFFTVLILDIAIYGEGKTTLQQRMQSSAQNIKENFDQELKNILFTLDQFDQSEFLQEDIDLFEKTEKLKVGQRSVWLEVLEEQVNLGKLMNSLCHLQEEKKTQNCLSGFRLAFWMDQDGSLRINWAKEQAQGITTNLPLENREYVKRVLRQPENLWRISDSTRSKKYQFFLEPIISWTTGLNTVVASMPSRDTNKKPNGWVAAMEFTFLSLMDHVVLPPGIGFAVIDSNHDVLFHSKEKRNLREAFLVETDHNPKLRDLFAAKTAGHADGSYRGQSTSFYTLPLDPLPWALVVYRDREILRSVNLFGLLVTGSLYGLWSILVYGIAWLLLLRTPGPRKAICLWPNPEYHHHYVYLIKNNLVMFFLGLSGIWLLSGQPGWQLLIGLVFIPASCLLSAVFLVKKIPSPQKTSWVTFPNSYAYLASSFLLVFAVIPAFGCFTSVFHKEMTLLTQYQLLETFKTFQDSGKQQTLPPLKNSAAHQDETKDCIPTEFWSPTHKGGKEASHSALLYGFYPDFFLESTWTACEKESTLTEQKSGIFDQLFALASQPFLPLLKNVPLWAFLGEDWPKIEKPKDNDKDNKQPISQKSFNWDTEQEHLTVFLKNSRYRVSADLPLQPWFLSGNNPDLSFLTLGKMIAFLLITGIFMIWIITIPKFIATRTVFLFYPIPFRVPQDMLFVHTRVEPSSPNQLILGFPGQGKTLTAVKNHEIEKKEYEKLKSAQPERPSSSPYPLYFDLKALPPEQWKDSLSNTISSLERQGHRSFHVTVDHLERQWQDRMVNLKKLEFMEWLLTRSNHRGDLIIKVLPESLSHKKS